MRILCLGPAPCVTDIAEVGLCNNAALTNFSARCALLHGSLVVDRFAQQWSSRLPFPQIGG